MHFESTEQTARQVGSLGRRELRSRRSMRTCIGCRRSEERQRLIRVVANVASAHGPAWAVDLRRRLPGRAVSLHPARACIEAACKNRRVQQQLGIARPPSAAELKTTIRKAACRALEGHLATARRAGHLAIGADAVEQALDNTGELALVVITPDAGQHLDKTVAKARQEGIPVVVAYRTAELGQAFGRSAVAVVGLSRRSKSGAPLLGADFFCAVNDNAQPITELSEEA